MHQDRRWGRARRERAGCERPPGGLGRVVRCRGSGHGLDSNEVGLRRFDEAGAARGRLQAPAVDLAEAGGADSIWQTDRLARINPKTGEVVAWVDLTGLLPKHEPLEQGAVLNGIAYDAAGDRIFVTGKLWPKLFEIRVGK